MEIVWSLLTSQPNMKDFVWWTTILNKQWEWLVKDQKTMSQTLSYMCGQSPGPPALDDPVGNSDKNQCHHQEDVEFEMTFFLSK